MSFEEVAEWAASLPADDRVYVDAARGHIRLGEVVFADLGSTLHLWAYSGHELTPPVARALGEALVGWASRKDSGGRGSDSREQERGRGNVPVQTPCRVADHSSAPPSASTSTVECLAAAAALDGALHLLDDDESAQTLARLADQWRAQAAESDATSAVAPATEPLAKGEDRS
jgi:hypothetical protein